MEFDAARKAMVDCQIRPADVTRFSIIDAMLRVPREEFVPKGLKSVAYQGEHVVLDAGRVVLDPRVFAKMLDALHVGPADLVLDIGCTFGYSAAVLAHISDAVIALEQDSSMAQSAEETLNELNVENAVVVTGPLVEGAAKHGPYDVILLQGAVETIPQMLLDQLKPDGRIAAIFADSERMGQARLGLKTSGGLVWRRIFDATAPLLPGFEQTKEFEF